MYRYSVLLVSPTSICLLCFDRLHFDCYSSLLSYRNRCLHGIRACTSALSLAMLCHGDSRGQDGHLLTPESRMLPAVQDSRHLVISSHLQPAGGSTMAKRGTKSANTTEHQTGSIVACRPQMDDRTDDNWANGPIDRRTHNRSSSSCCEQWPLAGPVSLIAQGLAPCLSLLQGIPLWLPCLFPGIFLRCPPGELARED